jgi:hypothetical protein
MHLLELMRPEQQQLALELSEEESAGEQVLLLEQSQLVLELVLELELLARHRLLQ